MQFKVEEIKAFRDGYREVIESVGGEILADVTIHRTVTDMEEVFASEEYKALFEHYVDEHAPFMRKANYKNYKAHFTDDGIYEEYNVKGLAGERYNTLRKIEVSTTISDRPLHSAVIFDNMFFVKIRKDWAKTQNNRIIFSKMGVTVTE